MIIYLRLLIIHSMGAPPFILLITLMTFPASSQFKRALYMLSISLTLALAFSLPASAAFFIAAN
jgi:hypothetical protein